MHFFSITPSPDSFSMKQEPQISQEHSDRRSPPLLGSPGSASRYVVWPCCGRPAAQLLLGQCPLLHIPSGCCPWGRPAGRAPPQGLFLHAPDIGHSPPWWLWALVPDHHFDLIWPLTFSHILTPLSPLASTAPSADHLLLSQIVAYQAPSHPSRISPPQ